MDCYTKDNLRTFKDLYQLLQSFDNSKDVRLLLNTNMNWCEIQESLLRLFAKLNCIELLKDYTSCDGNFNLATFKSIRCDHDIFYHNNKLICLKDNGDSSDLTMIKNDKEIPEVLAISSKNLSGKNMTIGNLDIEKIAFYHNDNSKFILKIGLCVPLRHELTKTINQAKKTTLSDKMKNRLKEAIIINQKTLVRAFDIFIEKYKDISFHELINRSLKSIQIQYRPHQLYAINTTIRYIKKYDSAQKYVNILWGHVARSGKSYMMNGLIDMLNSSQENENYLIITTAPNETVTQYIDIVCTLKPLGFNIITDKSEAVKATIGKNVIILSKQLMTNDSNQELIVPNVKIILFDEAHHGGSTDLSKKLLNKYEQCHKIFITATYKKISNEFNINKTITWDLEDIEWIKTGTEENMDKLNKKHKGFHTAIQQCLALYKCNDIKKDYRKYPKLNIIGLELSNTDRVEINKDEWDWSLDTIFTLKKAKSTYKFKFIHSVQAMFTYVIQNIITKVETFNERNNQRKILNIKEPSVIMCFLPSDNISIISDLIKTVINQIDNELEICICNTKATSFDIKQNINQSLIIAQNNKKKAVIVLTGKQGHLGVTIEKCDLVLLMNNSRSMDYIFQSMFRCMTEANDKYYGHVIDFDIDRSIELIIEYGRSVAKESIPLTEAITNIIRGGIINLSFAEQFEYYDKQIMLINILKYFQKPNTNRIDKYLKTLEFVDINLSDSDLERIEKFLLKRSIAQKITIHNDNQENNTTKLQSTKSNTERDVVERDAVERDVVERNETIQAAKNFMRTIKHMIPIMCILTIGDDQSVSYISMMDIIKTNSQLTNILKAQFHIWWKKEMSYQDFEQLTDLFQILNLQSNDEITSIIATIKELFIASKNDRNEMSKAIDKYLIPAEVEKKSNAEISTPYELRQEMLDTLPKKFWTTPKKVLEPCCGKGGFVIDIFNRFKKGGLTDKTIIEKCIYFGDINPLNVFIATLLINPNRKYKLNVQLGDALTINWNVKFDAIIGNPPYNANQSTQGNTPLYNKFIEKFIDECTYLLFVIPSRWFSGGKGLDNFRNAMKQRKDIKTIIHTNDSKDWFKGVDIIGGVSYFLKDSKHNGVCLFNGIKYDLNKYERIFHPKFHSVIECIKNLESIERIMNTANYFRVRCNDKKLNLTGDIECFVSLQKSKSRLKRVDEYKFTNDNTFWKVITAEAAHKGESGFGIIFIGKPEQIHTDSYISFRVNSEDDAKSLKSYLETPFANLILSIRKISQHINKSVVSWIPLVPFDREWTNEKVFDYLNLSDDQIETISKMF